MKRLRGRVAAGALLVPLLAGCGSRVAPRPGGGSVVAAATTPVGVFTDPDPGAGAGVASSAATAPSDGSPRPGVPPQPGATPNFGAKHNNGVVKLALSAECVSPGSLLVVTITAPAKAGLGMVIGYSDHQAHGAMLTGETDAGGRYTWRVPVDPTVPEGEARVLVSATGPNWSQDGGGTADKVFRVAKSGC